MSHRKHKRRKHRNPARALSGGISSGFKSITSGFSAPAIKKTGIMAVGALTTAWVGNTLGNKVAALKNPWANLAASVATAGLMLAVPTYGQELFNGAMTFNVVKGVSNTGILAKLTGGTPALGVNELAYEEAMAELARTGMGELAY